MIIQRFAFWNPGTWQIPKLYWDAFSDEQRIHAICKQLGKVIAYADYLGINVDDIAARLKAIEEGQLDPYIVAKIEEWIEDNQPEIMDALDSLNNALPITSFDAENTVADAIGGVRNDLNAKFPVITSDIADDAVTTAKIADAAVTTAKIADASVTTDKMDPAFVKSVSNLEEANAPTSAIEPIYVGDWMAKSSLQGICVDGDDVYLGFRDATNVTPNIKHFSISGNILVNTFTNASLAHCNSMCYDTERELMFIATGPVFTITKSFTNFAQWGDQPGTINAIAFDNVTKTIWALQGLTGDSTQTVYKMEQDESEFTEFCTIANVPGRQDMTAHDDVLYINSTRRECAIFTVDRDNFTLTRYDSLSFSKNDSNGRWFLNEPEGMCIDSTGRFWLGFDNNNNLTNSDGSTTHNGIFTCIPYRGLFKTPPHSTNQFLNAEVVYLNPDMQTVFTLPPTGIRSFAQCKWLNLHYVREIRIDDDVTDIYHGWLKDNVQITVNSSKTFTLNHPIYLLGTMVQVRNLGTMVLASGLFKCTNTFSDIMLYLTGTTTINSGTTLIDFGVAPSIVRIASMGTFSGTYKCGTVNVTGSSQYIIGAKTGTY